MKVVKVVLISFFFKKSFTISSSSSLIVRCSSFDNLFLFTLKSFAKKKEKYALQLRKRKWLEKTTMSFSFESGFKVFELAAE